MVALLIKWKTCPIMKTSCPSTEKPTNKSCVVHACDGMKHTSNTDLESSPWSGEQTRGLWQEVGWIGTLAPSTSWLRNSTDTFNLFVLQFPHQENRNNIPGAGAPPTRRSPEQGTQNWQHRTPPQDHSQACNNDRQPALGETDESQTYLQKACPLQWRS